MESELDKYYKSGNTDNQALYQAILKDAGIEEKFINSNIGFFNLSQMISQTQIKYGEKFSQLNPRECI